MAILPPPGLNPAEDGAEGLQGYVGTSPREVSEGYPYDQPTQTSKSAVMTPLPDRVVAGYWPYWGSPIRLTKIPAGYNTVFLFHATPIGGAPGTTGAMRWNHPDDRRGAATNFKADLAEFRKTRTAILTVGGAQANVDISTRARAQTFLRSIKRIYGELGGFDGLDWNNYEGEQQPNTDQMIWISHQLKAAYGQSFAITSPPAPWRPADVTHCRAMIDEGVLDMVSPQYYDGSDLASEDYIVRSVDEWVEWMGDASRVGVGFGLANAVNHSTLADVVGAWKTLSASHPQIRGAYNWDISTDEGMGWQFAQKVAPLVMMKAPATPTILPPVVPMLAPIAATKLPLTNRATPSVVSRTTSRVSRLPHRVVGIYWSPRSGLRLNAVHPDYNVVWVDFADTAGGVGHVDTDERPDMATFKADMAELRRRAFPPRIILSGVGSPNTDFDVASTVDADQLTVEIIRIATDYGFDGFDWNLEHALPYAASAMEQASRAIVTEMRQADPAFSLTVSIPQRPSGDVMHTSSDPVHVDFVRHCADIIDLAQPQYDDHRFSDIDDLRGEVRAWLDCGLSQDQIGLLWTQSPTFPSTGDQQSASVAYINHIWDELTGTWANLRGMGHRPTALDQAGSWRFAIQVGPNVVKSGPLKAVDTPPGGDRRTE